MDDLLALLEELEQLEETEEEPEDYANPVENPWIDLGGEG